MQIPKSVVLGGRVWQIKRNVRMKRRLGQTDGTHCIIKLAAGQSPESEQHTYLHELLHAICFTMGWDKLNDNETKIDALAGMLLQALETGVE